MKHKADSKAPKTLFNRKMYHGEICHLEDRIIFLKSLNLNVGDCVDHNVESAPPRVQIIGSNSLGGQSVHQLVGEGLEKRTLDIAGLVAVSHVLNLAKDLQGVVHGGDHIVKAVSDALNAGIEFGISVQTVDGGISERAEFLLGAWGLLEDPFVKQLN